MTKKSFEKAMEELQQIVDQLESEDLPLEKALKKFEEGIQLSKFCSAKLNETEKKITLLLRDDDGTVRETLLPEDESA
jgi:exodeoxyribonuclease VII small subunit